MTFDKDEIKQSLTIEQVLDLVANLGGQPQMSHDGQSFTAETICHNPPGAGSRKLYYYDNTKLFRCYTECNDTFDAFELVMKVQHCDLYNAIAFVSNFFDLSFLTNDFDNTFKSLPDWKILNKYEANQNAQQQQIVELKVYDDDILKNLPHPRLTIWEKEGIKQEIMQNRGIAYDPKNEGIIIPHYNMDDQLVGIRERTLITEEEQNGKYRPAILNGVMYNHPLSFNLYNLNKSKDNIKHIKKALVVEGEKSCLLYASYFGEDNDISVAVCGSSLTRYQVQLLLSLGINELIIAFDKQFKELNDPEHKKWCRKLQDLYNKYGHLVQMSFMFDKKGLLQYKDSPIDEGPDIFMQLYKERIFL